MFQLGPNVDISQTKLGWRQRRGRRSASLGASVRVALFREHFLLEHRVLIPVLGRVRANRVGVHVQLIYYT